MNRADHRSALFVPLAAALSHACCETATHPRATVDPASSSRGIRPGCSRQRREMNTVTGDEQWRTIGPPCSCPSLQPPATLVVKRRPTLAHPLTRLRHREGFDLDALGSGPTANTVANDEQGGPSVCLVRAPRCSLSRDWFETATPPRAADDSTSSSRGIRPGCSRPRRCHPGRPASPRRDSC